MKFRNEYDFLSNMYYAPFVLDGITYQTVEHFYQSHKTNNQSQRITIINAATPSFAKRLGKKCVLISPFTVETKIEIMRLGIRLKFEQHSNLALKLLMIKEPIVEDNDWYDTFWGVSRGFGLNYTGKILEERKLEFQLRLNHITFNEIYNKNEV